jgi:hypothetical protein
MVVLLNIINIRALVVTGEGLRVTFSHCPVKYNLNQLTRKIEKHSFLLKINSATCGLAKNCFHFRVQVL